MSRDFDLERHRREKAQRLERRCEFLEGYVQRLERVLALALRCAVAGRGCGQLDLLAVLEQVVEEAERPVRGDGGVTG